MIEENKPRGVSLSPKSMVDSVADWPLHRVVEHLRKKEKEEKSDVEMDCRLFCRSGGIRFFDGIVGELAASYGVTKGRMCRWLSYHGISIAREDVMLGKLTTAYAGARKVAVAEDNPDIMDIIDGQVPYSPVYRDDGRFSFYVHASWVASAFADFSQVCGVASAQVAQAFMVRSLLTSDTVALEGSATRLQSEVERWDKWMRYRLAVIGVVVEIWGAV